jgi:Sel1 repeat
MLTSKRLQSRPIDGTSIGDGFPAKRHGKLTIAAVLAVIGAQSLVPVSATAQSSGRAFVPPSGLMGYYRPVAPLPQAGPPCGHYLTPPCATPTQAQVTIPPGASADQLTEMGLKAFAARQYSVAAGYFERAAAQGQIRAEAALGLMYVNGKGEPQDERKAVYWLTKAADAGHRVAEAQLGEFYEHGTGGVSMDIAKAVRYYHQSAAQHWWQAEYSLGVDYELGVGVGRSRATAIQLLNRAAADGQDGLSQDLVAMLERADTPRFATIDQMSAYLNSLRGRPIISGGGSTNPLYPNAQQQYNLNRMHAPGSDCSRPGGGGGSGC